jgi:hypothetical protein
MLVDHMLCAIDGARMTELAQVGSDVSRAYANGAISEDDHLRLWEAIQERRTLDRVAAAGKQKNAPGSPACRRQPCQSPDRAASIRRRRRIGYSGVLPSPVAELFTIGQTAALRIVLDEIRDHGRCTLPLAIIAARSGTSKSTVRRALRGARKHGILALKERRSDRRGVLSDTNIVTLISAEVRAWIFRRGGRQKWRATDTGYSDTSTRKPGMVSGYRSKGLSDGRYRLSADQRGALG